MDALVCATPVGATLRDSGTDDVAAAYGAGYADGIALLHMDGNDHSSIEPFHRIHARYRVHAELEHPTLEARTYIAGFRDAAADNLPCPPHAFEQIAA
jgi:hypothetical protein